MSIYNYIDVGDYVVVISTDSKYLDGFVGQKGIVKTIRLECLPLVATVHMQNGEDVFAYMRNLQLIPPVKSAFQYQDYVKIINGGIRTPYHFSRLDLCGQTGQVVGYDKRDCYYQVDCLGTKGWFSAECLVPINFEGEKFFNAGDLVIYEEKDYVIEEVSKTKFGYGQIVKINGQWIPSQDVKSGAGEGKKKTGK